MATIAEMFVKLGMDASDYKSGVQTATSETKKLQESFKRIEQAGKQISKAGKAITLGVTTPVLAAAGALVTFANSAQTSIQIERSFDAVAKSAGIMGDEMMKALQKSSRGLISNTDLMKNFNLASSLVSKEFATNLPNAFEYLGKVSASTGQSMDYMLDSLVRGVGRLSPLILDNLGIQVSLNEAYEIYARKIGKTVEELSKAEQQSAVMELTMAKLAETSAGMSDEFGTTGERIKVAMQNAKDAIGRNLVPALTEAGEKLLPVIERFGSLFDVGGSLHPIIDKVSTALGKLAEGAGKAVDWLSQLDSETVEAAASFVIFLAAAGPVLTTVGKLTTAVGVIVPKMAMLATNIGLVSTASLAGAAAVAGIAAAIVGVGVAVGAAVVENKKNLNDLNSTTLNLQTTAFATGQTYEQFRDSMLHAGTATHTVWNRIKVAQEQMKGFADAGLITTERYNHLTTALKRNRMSIEDYEKEVFALAKTQYFAQGTTRELTNVLENVAETAEGAAEATRTLTAAELEQNSQLAFIHDNLATYQTMLGNLKTAKEEYEKLPHWQQDGKKGQELIGIIQDIEDEFDKMIARATAQELYNAIMQNGVATRQEMETYLGYLRDMGLATEEELNFMWEQWKAKNELTQSLSWDAEGDLTIRTKEALLSIEEIKAQLRSIERNIGVTVNVSQMGQLPTIPKGMFKALGGPVEAGTAYVVGERGPEIYVPDVDGQIIPHHDIDKYTRTDSTENVMTRFGKFEEAGAEYVQNNYTLNMPTTADSSNVQMAFRMMEALGA